jgi:hypothetical protein
MKFKTSYLIQKANNQKIYYKLNIIFVSWSGLITSRKQVTQHFVMISSKLNETNIFMLFFAVQTTFNE